MTVFRALDRMDLSAQEIPQRLLRQLFETDADYAEALGSLDQVEGSLDRRAMLRDTLRALDELPSASAQFRKQVPARAHPILEHLEAKIRQTLNPKEAYNMVQTEIPKTFKHTFKHPFDTGAGAAVNFLTVWRDPMVDARLAALLFLSGPLIAGDGVNKPVTFAKDVAPILQAKCEECHRKGTAAPMSLATFQETRPWAKAIRERVITRNMPPWHIDKTVGIQHFQNDRSLTDEQISTVVRWVDSGAPPGDPKDLPPTKQWPAEEGWQLAKQFGEPDLIVKSEPYTMPAKGQDVWWRPLTAIPLTEPRWVRAVEIRPATVAGRRITHHALARLEQEEPGAPDLGPGAGGLLMEWAIGKQYDVYRPNTGKLLLPGAQIRWEMHYHASGEATRDHVELGVFLYPKGQEPKYRTRLTLWMATPGPVLDIPPNSIKETQAFHVLAAPARLENFQPHMHL
ncbi:MAG TPA: hypothetical protein VKJ01_07065, partial [Candidatus Solibacter sp.]|nr:hypothetical protein [Candidatus Solibacter sp.]